MHVRSDAVDLASLPNLGPASAAMLDAAGIRSVGELRRAGSVAAYLRVKQAGQRASLNLLWALEGAIVSESWQQIARERRTGLLAALEDAQRTSAAPAAKRRAPSGRGTSYAAIERFALALPEVTQAPHHDFESFRVRGKIFVTVPPGRTRLHVFVPEDRRDALLAAHAEFAEKLLWGGKVVGLRIDLTAASSTAVKAMVRTAYEDKAPKKLVPDSGP